MIEKSEINIHRNRVIKTLKGEVPDRLAVYDSFWPETERLYRERLNLREDIMLEDYFDLALMVLEPDEAPFLSKSRIIKDDGNEKIVIDGWGRKVRTVKGGYFVETLEPLVKSRADMDTLIFEPADEPRRFQDKLFLNAGFLNKRFACFGKTGGPFIRTALLRGEERWLMDLGTDPVFAKELAARVTDFLIEIGIESMKRGDCYDCGIWICDDIGSNREPIFSPACFSKIFQPLYAKMVRRFKEAGAKFVIFHSDGNILPFLEMMVEIGINGINPVEPKAGMDLVKIKKIFKNRLTLVGGMCNAFVLPSGNKDLIKEKVIEIIDAGKEGGVIIGSHSIGTDISMDDYIYYRGLVQELGNFSQ